MTREDKFAALMTCIVCFVIVFCFWYFSKNEIPDRIIAVMKIKDTPFTIQVVAPGMFPKEYLKKGQCLFDMNGKDIEIPGEWREKNE